MSTRNNTDLPSTPATTLLDRLDRAFDAVGVVVSNVKTDQWSDPTPCTEWDVRRLVTHLIGLNRIFTALLLDVPAPPRSMADHVEADPISAYRDTAAALLVAFAQPGVLERHYVGPRGTASGADRLHIRLYDLLAHGWDLARATDQPIELPDDLVEPSLAFARVQMSGQLREGRFGPEQALKQDARAIDRLAAFLGRAVAQP